METFLKRGALFFLLATLVLLVACTDYRTRDAVTAAKFSEDHIFTLNDGCKVSVIDSDKLTYRIYRVSCPDGSQSTQHSCGKSCQVNLTNSGTTPAAPIPDPEILREQKRLSALQKLTLEERTLLGLP